MLLVPPLSERSQSGPCAAIFLTSYHVVPRCRFEQTTPSQLAVLQLLWAHHVSSGKDDVVVSNVWLDTFIRHDDQVWLDYQPAFPCVSRAVDLQRVHTLPMCCPLD